MTVNQNEDRPVQPMEFGMPAALTRGYSNSFLDMLSRHPVAERPVPTNQQLDQMDHEEAAQ